jgi:hypothetical protein
MTSTDETIASMRRVIGPLLDEAMESVLTQARGMLDDVEQQRAKGLAEVAKKRASGLAAVDARRAELAREVLAMQRHTEAQEGRVELNIGGCHFETSVQTLRRVPHTFFDAYFSGRYAQDVCDDGSIFVDRDGEHFGHVLEYMRDGVVSVAEPGVHPSVSLLRLLKREFGFYCIELCAEPVSEPEMAYAICGYDEVDNDEAEDSEDETEHVTRSSMERYDASVGQWIAVAAMSARRQEFGVC